MRFDRQNVENLLVIAFGVLVLLILTACSDWVADLPSPPPPKEVTVSPSQFSHQVRFAAADTHLTEPEREGLDTFIARMDVSRGTVVYLTIADNRPVDRRRRDVVAMVR